MMIMVRVKEIINHQCTVLTGYLRLRLPLDRQALLALVIIQPGESTLLVVRSINLALESAISLSSNSKYICMCDPVRAIDAMD